MKKMVKRLLISALALMVVLGMSTSAFAYTAQDDDGCYKEGVAYGNQDETSMHVVYSTMGMLRFVDEGTVAQVNADNGTVDVSAKTSSSKTWGKITKLAFIEEEASAEEKDAAAADIKFENSEYVNGSASRVIHFSIPVELVGKKIPVCRYASTSSTEGTWSPFSEQAYIIVLHTNSLLGQLQTAYDAATDETLKANLQTGIENASYQFDNQIAMFSPEATSIVEEGDKHVLKLTYGSGSLSKAFLGLASEANDENAIDITIKDGKGYVDIPFDNFNESFNVVFYGKSWNNRSVLVDPQNREVVFLRNMADAVISDIVAQTFTGEALEPELTITHKNGKETSTLEKERDYTIEYNNNINAGMATATVIGKYPYAGEKTVEFVINKAAINSATVAAITAKTYNGKAQTPAVTVSFGGKNLAKDKDYTVAYANNTNAGTAKVTVTGKGNFTGTKAATFKINPASQTLKMSAAKKTVKFKKLKKKAQQTSKVAVSGAKTKVTYAKVGGAKKLSINKTTGKIKVAKKTKKGTYKIKVKATAAKSTNYKAATVTKTIKVKVK